MDDVCPLSSVLRRMYSTLLQPPQHVFKLIGSGKLDVRPVLTHVLGWSDFEEAVNLQRSGKAGKIVLKRDHP